MGRIAILVLGVVCGSGTLSAQEVRFRSGAGGSPLAEQVLRQTLAADDYRVIVGDTVLGPEQALDGDVIVLDATLKLEGRISGNLIGVRSDIFARPGARVGGSVVVMGGGFYGTSLARLESPPVDASLLEYRVDRRSDGVYVITAPGSRANLRLSGWYGFLLPRYDRVNAVTLAWGLEYSPGTRPLVPHVRGQLHFYTARAEAGGEAEVWWPLGRHAIVLRGGRVTRSNDVWTQGEVENSLWSVLLAMDTRSYYDARFAEAGLRLAYGTVVRWSIDLHSTWERARSLESEDPFSIFSTRGGFQPNTPVAEVDLASGTLGLGVELWPGGASRLEVAGALEGADIDVGSDRSFWLVSGRWEADLNAGGAGLLRVRFRGQVPASDEDTPPQRWRALGGWGSLATLVPLERQGDRMWWVQAEYRPGLSTRAGRLGRLEPWVRYAAGNAWVKGLARPATVHDVGVGVALGPLEVGVFTAPSDDFETVLTLGFFEAG